MSGILQEILMLIYPSKDCHFYRYAYKRRGVAAESDGASAYAVLEDCYKDSTWLIDSDASNHDLEQRTADRLSSF